VFRPKFGKDYTKPESWNALNFSENDETDQSQDFSELESNQESLENRQSWSSNERTIDSDQNRPERTKSKKRQYKRIYMASSDSGDVAQVSEQPRHKKKAKKRKYSSKKMVSDSSSDECASPRSQSKELNLFKTKSII